MARRHEARQIELDRSGRNGVPRRVLRRLVVLMGIALAGAATAANAADLYGRVLGPDGKEVKGVKTTLEPQGGGGAPLKATADNDGRFEYLNLRPGRYWLKCGGSALEVTVAAGDNIAECRAN